MHDRFDLLKRIALGAAGGFAGTLALQGLLTAGQKWLPSTVPPLRQDPGEFMVEKVEDMLPEPVREQIPDTVETAAARLLGMGYGITFGALYAALRPDSDDLLRDGCMLGMVVWAAGYLGWLPVLGLMPPVWQHQPQQTVAPAAEHVAYGMTAVAAYHWLHEHV